MTPAARSRLDVRELAGGRGAIADARYVNDASHRQLILLLGAATTIVIIAVRLGVAFWPELTHVFPSALLHYECPLHHLTGVACPTCGGTRAILALAHGHPLRAMAWNPLVTLGALGLPALALLAIVAPRWCDRSVALLRRILGNRWGRAALVAAALAQMAHMSLA